MISGPECKHIGSSDSYFCNKKKLNRLKINNSEIHQRIEATGKIAAPKLERQIQRITAYQSRSLGTETSVGTITRAGKLKL